jgi:hypothetical protein
LISVWNLDLRCLVPKAKSKIKGGGQECLSLVNGYFR